MAGEYASLLYGENLVGIDIATLQMLFPLHYKDFFIKYSAEYNIDPSLSYAVMREESRYNKNIVSFANAVGLMQIMPSTAKFISGKTGIKNYDLTNPEDNIRMGTYYLQFLTRYFTESELILSCYNAGPGRTIRWHNIYRNYPNKIMYELIPIEETRHYIRKVTRSYYIYKFLIKNEENINKTIASLKK
ncbi:MAG: hypothetical protein A2086_06440 [Spirochaetes bacterium GWD1_27_9]|nr:MAG: hypothetical protein A2Z98_01960 [Spirochaetes bacterium GWB1_27_13]OHD36507.1 MAG: hypothetical protein A2086_06440 [Spirochaetes bacterium GWD1_27_9]